MCFQKLNDGYNQRTILLERALPISHMLCFPVAHSYALLVYPWIFRRLKWARTHRVVRRSTGRYGITPFHAETQIIAVTCIVGNSSCLFRQDV
ncbi:hypothetical protein J6590_059773 [Homalodisca vitripennis]|nr:hypothetical protein J6590_059773 [Homalodisca vitripennis]